jgi:3',5'-cyclic AMP phosphodiesterase CpdA
MPPDLNGTIWQHKKLIDDYGYCWWGWWKANSPTDDLFPHTEGFEHLVESGPTDVGLFSISLGRAYVARVTAVSTHAGSPIPSPELGRTPLYYRKTPYPAWFKLESIERVDGRTITEESELEAEEGLYQFDLLESRFRKIEDIDATVQWLERPQISPITDIVQTDRKSVLHLSDLHFGDSHVWHTDSRPRQSGVTLLSALKETFQQHRINPESIGVVVVTGDISDHGPDPDRYSEAKEFFSGLFRYLKCKSSSLVIVPGNHDVVRTDVDSAEDVYDFTANVNDPRTKSGELAYSKFLLDVFGFAVDVSTLRRFELPDHILNFVQLNSTLPRDQRTKEYGYLGAEPLKLLTKSLDLNRQVTERGEKIPVDFVALHHHPVSTVRAEYVPRPEDLGEHVDPVSTMVDQSNLLDWCSQYRIRFVLHGHQHKLKARVFSSVESAESPDAPFFTHILSAGSAGASWRPDDDPLSFTLLEFADSDTVTIRSFALEEMLFKREVLRDFRTPASGWLLGPPE